MATHLLIAPAASGKTEYVLRQASAQTAGLATRPLICVPSNVQRRSAELRLARMGGALGVAVCTLDSLYAQLHQACGEPRNRLGEPARLRRMLELTQSLAASGSLPYHAPLAAMPGFARRVCALIDELREAGISPADYAQLAHGPDGAPRIQELAMLYQTWLAWLARHKLADFSEIRRLAVAAVQSSPSLPNRATTLFLDGFDHLSGLAVDLLTTLHLHNVDLVITLTGDPLDQGETPGRSAQGRFHATRRTLEQALSIHGQPLPSSALRPEASWQRTLRGLSISLQKAAPPGRFSAAPAVEMVEATTPSLEAREAVRWVKERIVRDGFAPQECAILARNIDSYAEAIEASALEFGVPVHFSGGTPLASHPLVDAVLRLLDVLRLDDQGQPLLPRSKLVGILGSPYFAWNRLGFHPGDAQTLEDAALAAGLVAGVAEWRAALDAQVRRSSGQLWNDEGKPASAPQESAQAVHLAGAFEHFVQALTPPQSSTKRAWVQWLAERLGDAPTQPRFALDIDQRSTAWLCLRQRMDEGDNQYLARDRAALDALEEILQALSTEDGESVPYSAFVDEVGRAVASARCQPVAMDEDAVFVSSAREARGAPFRATALLGLAEGVFPARLQEDPFLRDDERQALRRAHPLLRLPTDSAEHDLLLEMVTRPADRLLVTRPRFAERAAEWLPSPYWQDMLDALAVTPRVVRLGQPASVARAASLAELLQAAVLEPASAAAQAIEEVRPGALAALERSAEVVVARTHTGSSPFEGDLSQHPDAVSRLAAPDWVWSPSALETYRACGFHSLTSRFLRIESPSLPEDGMSRAMRGRLLHRLLAETHDAVRGRLDRASLLTALEEIGPRLLEGAPRSEGFSPPPGWRFVREELLGLVRSALSLLGASDVVAVEHEVVVGDPTPLRIQDDGGDSFALRGRVDRVDTLEDGTLRVIDYKSGGGAIDKGSLVRGERFQLPLYAWAIQQERGVEVTEGFYFSLSKREAGDLHLSDYAGGVEQAIADATAHAWLAVRGARSGDFAPRAPADGCPDFCPAAGFCWKHRKRFW